MKKFRVFLVTVLMVMSAGCAYAASTWIDVTDEFIVNPSFVDNDLSTGWSGTAFGSYNPIENAEHYNKTYDTYQTITGLNAGKYRLSLKAFYRSGLPFDDYNHYTSGDPSSYQHAYLYASSSVGNQSVPIVLDSSAALENSLGGGTSIVGGSYYIPNNMDAAHYWFEAGYYDNSVEIEVGSDGELTIGIRKSSTIAYDWTCLDDWKLEYYGELVNVSKVTLNSSSVELNIGETFQLNASYSPTNATYKKCTWSSSDESVATVDQTGLITCLKRGTTTITATSSDGNAEAQCTVNIVYNGANASSLIINEIMVANLDMFVDPSWNYGSWVELYNPSDQSASVGYYWVSDNPDSLKMAMLPFKVGSIPAHGYLTLWFEHADTRKDVGDNWTNTQVNMELDADGGTIYISDDAGNLIASQTYPAAIHRASYARTTDGGSTWAYTADPTPTATNATSTFADEQIEAPTVNLDGRLFTGSLNVNVSKPAGSTLMYTTDGTTPTLTNGTESSDGSFKVSKTTTYRFRAFRDGYLPSEVITRSYILKDKDYYFPVVSVVTNPKNLYDNKIGVYVTGTNGKTANQDATKRNFNMEWDRPVNFEYMKDEEVVFNQETNFSINGGWSRKYEPRSFKIKAKKLYGVKDMIYPFFDTKSHIKNKSLLFRNGGNDNYNQTRIKDAALQEIARQSGFRLNLQAYQPVHVFINGSYLAMLNMREVSNKHYAYANYGIDTDDIDAFEMSVDSGYVQTAGTKDAFNQWYSLSANASDALTYQQICDMVDIDDYVNYMAYKFFLNDWDWPHNNLKAFKGRTDGKFHFIVFDLDNCVTLSGNNIFNDFAGKQWYRFYSRPEYNWTSIYAEVEMVTIFLNMLKNEEFKKKFIDTYCLVGGCVFGDETEISNIVSAMADNINTALSWEGHSATSLANTIINSITGKFKSNMINMMKNYSTFGLSSTEAQSVQISSNVENGRITYNNMEIPKSKFNGYVFAPVTLKAEAPAGYKFAGWKDAGETSSTVKTLFSTTDTWNYYDQGSLDNTGWNLEDYSENDWSQGTAPFGYGNTGKYMASATTQLDWGTNTSNRTSTYYFRKTFNLDSDPADNETYTLNYEADDAIIAYVNGNEIGSYHLYSGATYSTLSQDLNSSWYEADTPHYGTMTIDKSFLKKGTNVIAVELHNCTLRSSDAWWDASITVTSSSSTDATSYVSTDAEYTIPSTGSHVIVAEYKAIDADELIAQHVTPVKVNEVSAANDIYVDDYGKRHDWIELYNTTNATVDVAGMYVSDNLSKPYKYQIPSGTINTQIPAHGYLVVWCDKVDAQTELHTSFKLASEGGIVLLTAEDESWADTLEYCEHNGKQTVGLYPDGGTATYVMDVPTIGESNRISSYDVLYSQPHLEPNTFEFAMGDVNTDSLVNVTDYTALVSLIMKTDDGAFNLELGDFNGNGMADVADLTSLVYLIKNESPAKSVIVHKAQTEESLDNYGFGADNTSINAGDITILAVNMKAFADDVMNVQFDVKLPEGINMVDVQAGELASNSHAVTMSELSDNTYRLMLHSQTGKRLVKSGGCLMLLTLKANDNASRAIETVDFTNIYASLYDATLVHIDDVEADLSVGDATGIDYIQNDSKDSDDIYDISGRRVSKISKGMYIVNGKKVYVK